MLLFSVPDAKRFMNFLFKDNIFSEFEARGIILHVFTKFEISCQYDNSYNEPTEQADSEVSRYCLWRELAPVVSNLIKGKKPPKLMKIVLCISGEKAQKINENAAALFMTIKYEGGCVSVLTGTSQKQFSLDKEVDIGWDEYVIHLFEENGFEIDKESEQ